MKKCNITFLGLKLRYIAHSRVEIREEETDSVLLDQYCMNISESEEYMYELGKNKVLMKWMIKEQELTFKKDNCVIKLSSEGLKISIGAKVLELNECYVLFDSGKSRFSIKYQAVFSKFLFSLEDNEIKYTME